jgi:hypothetical protein
MFCRILFAIAALAIVGCEMNTKADPYANKNTEPAQLAAFAATAKYPTDAQPKEGMNVAVLDHGDNIRLINFREEPVRNVNVWVNGMFVHHVDMIPSMGSVTLDNKVFYDGTGRPLTRSQTAPMRITLQQDQTIYSTLGPVNDNK